MASGDILASGIAGGHDLNTDSIAAAFNLLNTATGDRGILEFDDTTDEEAIWTRVLNPNYGGGGLTLTIAGWMTSATSGNLVLQAAIERLNATIAAVTKDFASMQSSGTTAVPGTARQLFLITITFTSGAQMDSLGAGEFFRLKVRRDADDTSATDSASGDFEMMAWKLTET